MVTGSSGYSSFKTEVEDLCNVAAMHIQVMKLVILRAITCLIIYSVVMPSFSNPRVVNVPSWAGEGRYTRGWETKALRVIKLSRTDKCLQCTYFSVSYKYPPRNWHAFLKIEASSSRGCYLLDIVPQLSLYESRARARIFMSRDKSALHQARWSSEIGHVTKIVESHAAIGPSIQHVIRYVGCDWLYSITCRDL